MNDLDLCLEVVMSTIALHSPLNILETARVEAWLQRKDHQITNRKRGNRESNGYLTDYVT